MAQPETSFPDMSDEDIRRSIASVGKIGHPDGVKPEKLFDDEGEAAACFALYREARAALAVAEEASRAAEKERLMQIGQKGLRAAAEASKQ